jgi:hypothetical protein
MNKVSQDSGMTFIDIIQKIREIQPGYRFFHCDDCNHTWREKCRDVLTPSQSGCEKCCELCDPCGWASHPEWPVDKHGNLIDDDI